MLPEELVLAPEDPEPPVTHEAKFVNCVPTAFDWNPQPPALKTLLLDRLLTDLSHSPVVEAGDGWQPTIMPVVDTYIMLWENEILVSDDFQYCFEVRGLPPPNCARGEHLEARTLKLRLLRWTFQVVPSGSSCSGREEVKVYILARQWVLIAADYDFLEIDIIPQRIEKAPGLKNLILTAFVAEASEQQTIIKSKKIRKPKHEFETPQSDPNSRPEAPSGQESLQTSRFGVGNTESDHSQ